MAVASKASETQQRAALAYGSSILVMMASPFVLIAIVGFLAFRSAKKDVRRAAENERRS